MLETQSSTRASQMVDNMPIMKILKNIFYITFLKGTTQKITKSYYKFQLNLTAQKCAGNYF